MRSKKQLILWVLNILNSESDENHPLTQTEIAGIISNVYPCDRKTVCRNIKTLLAMGYPIKKTTKGFYMDKKVFTVDEINFIQEAIKASPNKNEDEKEDLAVKVVDALSKMYRR